MNDIRIVKCEIQANSLWSGIALAGIDLAAGNPEVVATFDDGTVETLFSYYVDELSFTSDQFIGLTRAEALAVYRDADMHYLRS